VFQRGQDAHSRSAFSREHAKLPDHEFLSRSQLIVGAGIPIFRSTLTSQPHSRLSSHYMSNTESPKHGIVVSQAHGSVEVSALWEIRQRIGPECALIAAGLVYGEPTPSVSVGGKIENAMEGGRG